jgi:hypothetical protein
MSNFVLFFRPDPVYLELEIDLSEREMLPLWELMEDLKLELVGYIKGRNGENLPLSDINLTNLNSSSYEVGGWPTDYNEENDDGLQSERKIELVISKKDIFERPIWIDVVNFLSRGMFPTGKECRKAKENFKRRCRLWYSLGMENADGPTLYFTSSGRGKPYGKATLPYSVPWC